MESVISWLATMEARETVERSFCLCNSSNWAWNQIRRTVVVSNEKLQGRSASSPSEECQSPAGYIQGSTCTSSVNLDPSRVSPACQAEENAGNFNCMTTQVSHCCHLNSRSAVSDAFISPAHQAHQALRFIRFQLPTRCQEHLLSPLLTT